MARRGFFDIAQSKPVCEWDEGFLSLGQVDARCLCLSIDQSITHSLKLT